MMAFDAERVAAGRANTLSSGSHDAEGTSLIAKLDHERHGNHISATFDARDGTASASGVSLETSNSLAIMQQLSETLENDYGNLHLSGVKESSWLTSKPVGSGSSMDQRPGILQDILGNGHPRKAKHKKSRARSYKDFQASEEPTASPLVLEKSSSLSMAGADSGLADMHSLTTLEVGQIRAFAKLEFDDGPFYMNTYSVELGRDVRAAKVAGKDDVKPRERSKGKSKKRSASLAPQTTPQAKRDGGGMMYRSVVSESGGVMALDLPDEDDSGGYRWKKSKGRKNSKISRSTSSSSRAISRKDSSNRSAFDPRSQFLPATVMSHRASYSHPVNPFSLLPSPDECPLIPIHPPAVSAETGGHRGISRKHVRIAFNFDKHLFEIQIKGKNGAFVDDRWHASGETLPLRSGTHIQIGGVSMRFVLPDVVPDEAIADEVNVEEQEGEGGMSMTGDDNSDDDDDDGNDSSDEEEVEEEEEEVSSEEDEKLESGSSNGDEVEGEEIKAEADEDEDEEEGKVEEKIAEPSPSPPPIPKKRGPGRPPKNGMMSIQKQRQAQKQAQTAKMAKKKDPSPPPVVPKRKVGRPRKHPLPEGEPSKGGKKNDVKANGVETTTTVSNGEERKKKKKSSEETTTEGKEATKERKEKKSSKPPRSPSPVFNEAELTAEQLQKPQTSYVVLIHEALSNSKTGPMSLPQIYRAIERRYPYFKLKVTTNGWQSSVRHNLSQCEAFRKVQRDGKGWMWGLVEGMSIQKERRRKASTGAAEKASAKMKGDQSGAPAPPGPGKASPSGFIPPPQQMGVVQPGVGGGKQYPGHPPHHGQYQQHTTLPSHSISGKTGFPNYPPPPPPPPPQFSHHHYPQIPSMTQSSRVYHSPYAPHPSPNQHNLNYSNSNQTNLSVQSKQPPRLAPQAPAPFSTVSVQPALPTSSSKEQQQQPPPNDLLTAISDFKSALINSLDPKSTNNVVNSSNREQIVQSAINRALGLSSKSSVTTASPSTRNGNGDAEAMMQIERYEKMIIKGVKTLLQTFTGGGGNGSGSSRPVEKPGGVNGNIAVGAGASATTGPNPSPGVGVGESGESRATETKKRTLENVDVTAAEGLDGGDDTTAAPTTQMNKRMRLTSATNE